MCIGVFIGLLQFSALAQISPADRTLDADQFLRVLHGAHDDLKTVSLLFEGESSFEGLGSFLTADTKRKSLGERFQFSFAYRHDGAAITEGYHESLMPNATPFYRKMTLLKDRLESVTLAPDRRGSRLPAQVAKGSPEMLLGERVPAFFYIHYFNALTSPEDLGYQFHGWESIDGKKCLVVSLDILPRRLNPNIDRFKFNDPTKG